MDTILLSSEFAGTIIKLAICLFVNWFIISQLYYRKSHRRDFFFTFMLMSVAIFFLVYFMMGIERGKASMGVGLGLFGIFSIMRYRTDAMPVREMTYLFVIICLSVVHAMADNYWELVLVDAITILSIWLCELSLKVQQTKLIQYDRIELVKPERRQELIADLEERTGLKILKVDVGGIDFLKDTAVLRITYAGDSSSDVDGQFKVRKSQWREFMIGVAVLFTLAPLSARAQSEGGLLLGAEAEKKLNKELSVSLGADFRTRNDFKTVDRWSGSVGIDYKLTKWLKADAGYKLLYDNNREKISSKYWRPSYWGTRHRVNASLTGTLKLPASLKLSLRERWQYTYRPETTTDRYYFSDYGAATWTGTDGWTAREKARSGKAKNQLRSRLQIEYDKKRSTLKPYASMELYHSWGIEKVRYTLGTSLKLAKQHSLDLYYRFQDQRHVDESDYDPDMHYLGIGYKFKF